MSFAESMLEIVRIIRSDPKNGGLVILMVLLALLYEMVASRLMNVLSSFYTAIADDNKELFSSTIVLSLGIVLVLSVIKALRSLVREYTAMYWRLSLVTALSDRVLTFESSRALYLTQSPFPSSMDQR